jgi:hypothetical protein
MSVPPSTARSLGASVLDRRFVGHLVRSAVPLLSLAAVILVLLAVGHSWWELLLVAAFGLLATQPTLAPEARPARYRGMPTPDDDPEGREWRSTPSDEALMPSRVMRPAAFPSGRAS